MDQKIADSEYRILFLLADDKIDTCPVFFHDYAVQRQGQRYPLVFFNAAIIMGVEKGKAFALIKRILL